MKTTLMVVVFGLTMAIAAPSTAREDRGWGSTRYGEYSELGDGALRAYYKLTFRGRPKVIGVEMTGSVFQNMPTSPSDGVWDILDAGGNVVHPCCGHERVLDMPRAAGDTPFESIVVNYNPIGHSPPGIYDLPHFDFHFYLIDEEERHGIAAPLAEGRCEVPGPGGTTVLAPLSCDVFDKAVAPLPADMQVPGYASVGAVEPGMGNHMVNPTAPEFSGSPFTQTWIYGTWEGELSIFETMITSEFLLDLTGKECVRYPMPEALPEAGWYPTAYCVQHRPWKDTYRVSLERWKRFPETSGVS